MKKLMPVLAAAAVIALAGPALAAEDVSSTSKVESKVEQKSDGSYVRKEESKKESSDASGTDTKVGSRVKVEENADGNMDKTVRTKAVVDLKGLGNEETTETTFKVKKEDGKTTVSKNKTVNGKIVEETTEENNPENKNDNNNTQNN